MQSHRSNPGISCILVCAVTLCLWMFVVILKEACIVSCVFKMVSCVFKTVPRVVKIVSCVTKLFTKTVFNIFCLKAIIERTAISFIFDFSTREDKSWQQKDQLIVKYEVSYSSQCLMDLRVEIIFPSSTKH